MSVPMKSIWMQITSERQSSSIFVNVYEDWMDEPEIILIDKDGVALYSNEGKQLNRIEHTPTYLDLAKYASDDLLPTFVVPIANQIRKMIEHGIQVVEMEDNFIQITNQSVR